MKAILQRVSESTLKIDGMVHSSIETGLLVLLGLEQEDSIEDVNYLVSKIVQMRIFSDDEGKMNRSVMEINGDMMVVSQFTLLADTKKGNRPSFIRAAKPEKAIPLYEAFIDGCNDAIKRQVKTGVFGADMKISLTNDGPVTIVLDSKVK